MVKLFPSARRHADADAGRGGILPGGPDAVEVGGRWVRVGEEYAATLTVTGYPARNHREFLRAQAALYRLAEIVDDVEALVRRGSHEPQR